MKTYAGVPGELHTFLILALDGNECSASCSSPQGKSWTEGWVDPRTSLDAVKKREISCPNQEMTSNSSAIWPIA
jgi:hypothetical protein